MRRGTPPEPSLADAFLGTLRAQQLKQKMKEADLLARMVRAAPSLARSSNIPHAPRVHWPPDPKPRRFDGRLCFQRG
eukprot:3147389-Pyramimonas_sp.AAC.1